jgi:hypothetical protein
MTIQEIDELIDDTKRLPRATDKVAVNAALATMEIARQLIMLNQNLAAMNGTPKAKSAATGKKK